MNKVPMTNTHSVAVALALVAGVAVLTGSPWYFVAALIAVVVVETSAV